MSRKRMAVVVNGAARSGSGVAASIIAAVEAAGHEAVDCSVEHGEKMQEAVRNAVALKPDVLIIGGGDGTVTMAAQIAATAGLPMGIVPLGTTNNFARSVGLPLTIEEALAVIFRGHERTVYLGTVNGHAFCNVAAMGISAVIAREVSDDAKRIAGRLAYGAIGLSRLADHDAFRCTLSMDKESHVFETHELIVANGRFHSASEVSPDATPEKPHLVAVVFGKGPSRWRHIKTFARFLLGTHHDDPDVLEFTATSFQLETVPVMDIEIDGEVCTRTPARFGIYPHDLRIFFPEQTA